MPINAITLQEIMLGLTFLLTFFNVYNNLRNARHNSIANDPTISGINVTLAELQKDITHIRQTADQSVLHREITELKAEIAQLKAKVDILMQSNGK